MSEIQVPPSHCQWSHKLVLQNQTKKRDIGWSCAVYSEAGMLSCLPLLDVLPRRSVMSCRLVFCMLVVPIVSVCLCAQGVQPYPNAVTDRQFYAKTPMAPPPANTVFQDPDRGASIDRDTYHNTQHNMTGDIRL